MPPTCEPAPCTVSDDDQSQHGSEQGVALTVVDKESASKYDFNVVNRRTLCLVSCLGIQITCGCVYLFPAYAASLAEELNLTDTQLQLVAVMNNLGRGGVLPGLLCDKLGSRRGVVLAAFVAAAGFVSIGLAYDGILPGHTAALMAYMFVFAQGASLGNVSTVKCAQGNFLATDRAPYIGLLTAFFGASSGAFSLMYKTLIQPYTDVLSTFMYFAAAVFVTVQVVCSYGLTFPRATDGAILPPLSRLPVEAPRATVLFAVTALIVCIQFIFGIVDSMEATQTTRIGMLSGYAGALLLVPLLAIFWRCRTSTVQDGSQDELDAQLLNSEMSPLEESNNQTLELSSPTTKDEPLERIVDVEPTKPGEAIDDLTGDDKQFGKKDDAAPVEEVRPELTLKEAVRTPDLWLLVATMMCGPCFPLAMLNNLAGLVASLSEITLNFESWGDDSKNRNNFQQRAGAFVAIFSCCNVTGCLLIGRLAARFKNQTTPEFWLCAMCLVSLGANALFLSWMQFSALYVVVPLCGFAVGGISAVAPLCTSRRFGLKSYGSIWGLVIFSPSLSTLGIGTFAAGHFADKRREEHCFFMRGRNFCHGTECYRPTVGIALGVVAIGAVASACFAWRAYRAASAIQKSKTLGQTKM